MDPKYFRATQIANTLAPAVGWLASLPATVVLIQQAVNHGTVWHLVSSVVFGASLIISYGVFTLYHVFKFHQRWGRLFRILDHSTIYLLIAGTYTPFTLVSLRGNWGWTLFGTVWGLTVVGVVFKVFFVHRFKVLGPLLYLAMGWLIVVALEPAMRLIPTQGLLLLLAGGFCYSFGLIFYAWKRLLFHHAIWHLFVLAGSSCHYVAVYCLVITPAAVVQL